LIQLRYISSYQGDQCFIGSSGMYTENNFSIFINGMTENRVRAQGEESHPEDPRGTTGIILKTRTKTKRPSMYKVLLLNDDYTPMEFVVHVLERFFNKTRNEATDIMLHVHRRGVGICGVFTYEIAETKVAQVMDYARANEQPLQCTMEKE